MVLQIFNKVDHDEYFFMASLTFEQLVPLQFQTQTPNKLYYTGFSCCTQINTITFHKIPI